MPNKTRGKPSEDGIEPAVYKIVTYNQQIIRVNKVSFVGDAVSFKE